MTQKIAVIFGGTGFVGRHVVRAMAARGWLVKIATRVPECAYFLKTAGDVGQIVAVQCDYSNYDAIASIVQGADYVVNCVGILYERCKGDFVRIHVDLPESIAAACAVAGVQRFVHISALAVDRSSSHYAMSKLEGEKRVQEAFSGAVVLRPSVIFGADDNFFNQFARLAGVLPVLPLIGGGRTKFQPVFVGDVAEAVMNAVTLLKDSASKPFGFVYEIGGPDVLTFEQIYEKLFEYTGQKKYLLPLSFCLAKIQAVFLGLLPVPLLTMDQVESLKTDNIVSKNVGCLRDLNVAPTAMDLILPDYLTAYRSGGRFAS